MEYEQRSILERRRFTVTGETLVFQRRNVWGTLTDEVVIPFRELRPEISRGWYRDSQLQQVVFWCVVGVFATTTVLGFNSSLVTVDRIKWVLIGTVVLAGAFSVTVLRRREYANLYYSSGTAAASIGREGPAADQFPAFIEHLRAQLKAPAAPDAREAAR